MPPSTPPIDEKSDSLGPGGLSLIVAMAVVLGFQVGLAVKAFVSNVYFVNAGAAEVEVYGSPANVDISKSGVAEVSLQG